ncbi:MAG TPA: DUF5686 and carboxypeptidase regulatory-like domain-containing protein [Saprospiraceae bacterium]|nr:DUF5686 and carboxypeptidase regulatory-like domain-containing protein [Saprospiraceae bacterium]
MLRPVFLLFFLNLIGGILTAGGIKGTIKNERGEFLPFASIYIRQTGSGTVSNLDGYYEIPMEPGRYDLIFQYLGYEALERSVNVGQGFTVENIVLKAQALELGTVEVVDGREDPAYTIMRKAIAKASFHRQQLDSYDARVYVKGSGRLLATPGILRKAIEKQGVDSTMAFLTESVSEISYRRPNTYKERVISIRKQGNDNSTSPMSYINGSFYEPEVVEAVSPLSPSAFAYYKFEFEGSYIERGFEINKIKVTPRNRGEGVFEGVINIVEDWWSIHSLELKTYKLGIEFGITQIFAPIENKVWLPVTHKYQVYGKIFGFKFEYNYLAAVSDYKIAINPDLDYNFEVVDEKIEKELAAEIESKKLQKNKSNLEERVASGQELTRKELRQMMKEYAKAEREKAPEPQVIQNTEFKIDSAAYNRDTVFWDSIRPVPLTVYEVKSYKTTDSLALVEKQDESGDQKKKDKKPGFDIGDLLVGDSYKLSKNTRLILGSPLASLQFNTVEGYAFNVPLTVKMDLENSRKFSFGVKPRYAFAREKLLATGHLQFENTKPFRSWVIRAEGGKFTFQLNQDEPVNPLVNTLYTLLFERNYMKIFEKEFVKLNFKKQLADNFSMFVSGEWAQRFSLENEVEKGWIEYPKRKFTANNPQNIEIGDTEFDPSKIALLKAGFEWLPWQKYRISNGKKEVIENSSPVFSFQYSKAMRQIFDSNVAYDLVEAGFKNRWKTGATGLFSLKLLAGKYISGQNLGFPDFKHFPGNRTIFATLDPVESFRLLDYYVFSTREAYVELHAQQQFRKFLLTQIPELWLVGLKENLFFNFLHTPALPDYWEGGYALDNILRIFRLEVAVSMKGWTYGETGFRIGIASFIGSNVSGSSDGDSTSISIKL